MKFFGLKKFITRWTNYEYWPWIFFYAPLIPVYLYYAIRSGYLFFSSAVNPGIDKGGLFGESKIDILDNFSDDHKPKTYIHKAIDDINETLNLLKSKHFELPLILKPNIGERGTLVSKANTFKEVLTILKINKVDFIIQEFIDYPFEFGVLYARIPGEEKGQIRSIVTKKFLEVTGDGVSTIGNLLLKNKRAWFQIERLAKENPELLSLILPLGETRVIEHIGNHCRGTEFIDANYLINDQLNEVFDKIARQFEGFYYGRFDLKVRSIEEFKEGKTIKIFELNGVTAEAGHIYDKNYTLFKAYRAIIAEQNLVYKISMANIKKGIKPYSIKFMLGILKTHFKK